MKVLYIASGDLWAGAEKQLYTLLLALRQSGHIGVMAVILNPGTLAEELRNKYPASKVCVIHNGLDLAQSSARKENKFQDPLIIGIVGRLVPVKRVDLFLEIAKSVLSQQSAAAKPIFRVIGDGPLRSQMESLADRLDIANQVDFMGHVDNAERAIAQLDVLILCSDHEGLPMVALEAWRKVILMCTGSLWQLTK
jgi:glycosyltransferase involved in cell wall biosynthesis